MSKGMKRNFRQINRKIKKKLAEGKVVVRVVNKLCSKTAERE